MAYDEDAALAAALKASLMDPATHAVGDSSPNNVPKLPTRPRVATAFPNEVFGFAEGKGFIRQIKIMDQWSSVFKRSVEEYKAPSAICGYVVAAVCEVLAEMFPSAEMTFEETCMMLEAVTSEEMMLPRIQRFMKVVHDDRAAYIAAHSDEFSAAQARHYQKDWVANYELSDLIKQLRNPAIHFIRHCERSSDVEHEEARRVAVEAPFRDLVMFVEAGEASGESLLLRPSEFVKRRVDGVEVDATGDESKGEGATAADDAGRGTAAASTAAEAASAAAEAANTAAEAATTVEATTRTAPKPAAGAGAGASAGDGDSTRFPVFGSGPCPVFMTDCLGHFVVTRPVLLQGRDAAGKPTVTPTLLLLNSMGGDFTLHVAVTAAHRMLFSGASETTDPLFLFRTHRG